MNMNGGKAHSIVILSLMLLPFLLPGLLPSASATSPLYGIAFTGPDGLSTLYTIDTSTGAATSVGPVGFQRCSAMDFDLSGTLFATCEKNDGTNTPVLITINTSTGAGTIVGPTGIAGGQVSDISFRNSDGKLFAFDATASNHKLYAINKITGAGTLVGSTGLSSDGGNGMAFSPSDTLYHIARDDGLHMLDQTTGAASAGQSMTYPTGFLGGAIKAMDYEPSSGTLYGISHDQFGTDREFLATIDTTTRTVTNIGLTATDMDAISFAPAPPDTTSPVVSHIITGTQGTNGWYKDGDVTVTWTVSDTESAFTVSGCGTQVVSSDTSPIGVDLLCSATSGGGTTTDNVNIKRDTAAPTTTSSKTGTAGTNDWFRSNVDVTLTATDASPGSGVASITYTLDAAAPVTVSGDTTIVPITGEGTHILSYFATDNAGDPVETPTEETIKIDTVPPTITASRSSSPNSFGWHNTAVTVTFTCSDSGSGITSCPAPIILGEGENQSVIGATTDNAGNFADVTESNIDIDLTAPTGTILIDDGAAATTTRSVTLDLSASDGLSGVATIRVAEDGVLDFEASESFLGGTIADRPATTTQFRGAKTMAFEVADKADNLFTTSDGINLDAVARDVLASNHTPLWGFDPVTVTGTFDNARPSDKASVALGSPTVVVDITDADEGTFTTTHTYERPSIDPNPHHVEATLVDEDGLTVTNTGGAPVSDADPDNVVAQRHPTSVILNEIINPFTSNPITVTGDHIDDVFGTGIRGKLIEFDGSGATPSLADATTGGPIITGSGMVLVDNKLRLNIGDAISIPSPTTYVYLHLAGMGTETVGVEVTAGDGSIFSTTGQGQGINTGLFTISHPSGISNIEITSISSGTVGISRIQLANAQQDIVIDNTFATVAGTFTTIPLFDGSFYSAGFSPDIEATGWVVDGHFDAGDGADLDYEPSASEPPNTNVQTYDTLFSTTTGVGTGNEAVVNDGGKGITSVLCADGNDNDDDALCNDWETDGGIPYTANGVDYRYPLLGANLDADDIYLEIDYMEGHSPDTTALQNVKDVYTTNGITIHESIDESLGHVSTMGVWIDSDFDDTNDFNSIKADHFGLITDARASVANAQTPGFANGSPRTITASGISLTTPADVDTGDDTDGKIFVKVKATFAAALSNTAFNGMTAGISYSGPASLTFGTLTPSVTSGSSGNIKIFTIEVPFTATEALADQDIGTITITLPAAFTTSISSVDTNPGSPTVLSDKMEARAQAYHYFLWAHSFGGPSGVAEIRGNDAVISLGEGFENVVDDAIHAGSEGSTNEQAATFMHELGHNLNLNHGGPKYLQSDPTMRTVGDSTNNCKPNYDSVMAYSRQLEDYMGDDWHLDYSHGVLPRLVEGTLTENAGKPISSDASTPVILWGTPGPVESPLAIMPQTFLKTRALPSGAATEDIDWSGNVDILDVGVTTSRNINNFGFSGCEGSGTTHNDYNDWTNLEFNFRLGASGQFDSHDPLHSDANDDIAHQVEIANSMTPGLVPPPEEDDTRNGKGTTPLKLELFNAQGQEIKSGVVIKAEFYSASFGFPVLDKYKTIGTFVFNPNPSRDFWQLDWKHDGTVVGDVWLNIYVENPGATPFKHKLLDSTVRFDPAGQPVILHLVLK